MILDIMTHIVHGIEANILVEEAGHSLQGSEDVCKISMCGEVSSIPKGVSHLLGYTVEGIGGGCWKGEDRGFGTTPP